MLDATNVSENGTVLVAHTANFCLGFHVGNYLLKVKELNNDKNVDAFIPMTRYMILIILSIVPIRQTKTKIKTNSI